MSKIYLISYDFKNPTSVEQEDFYAQLKKFGAWWHFIEGTWLVATELNAKAIYERLQQYLNDDVNLFIADLGSDVSGWLPKKAWDWIDRQQVREPVAQ